MEKIKAKVEQVLHKNDHTTDNTTGTHTGTHGTHGVTGNSGTHTGYTAEERRGNPTHIGETGHTGGLTGSTAHSGGLTGNTTHTGTHTGGGLTGNTYGSDPTGPHDSRLGNKADPRVDSDHVGSYGNTTGGYGNTTHTGGGLTGNTHNTHSDPSGPHDSKLANKLDPRVKSDQVGGYGNTTGHSTHTGTHTGGGLTGNTYGSDPTGPHDSRLGNKADPRVDSDHVGGYGNTTGGGLTGAGHTGTHTGGGLTGNTLGHNTYGSDPTGPHDSRLGNKADPRVDSDHVGGYGNTTGGLTGNTHTGHTGTHTGGGLTGNTLGHNTYGSDPTGPHDSHLANRADPRVDSDQVGGYGNTASYGNTTGGGLSGNTAHGTHGTHNTHGGAGGLTGQGSHLQGSHLPGPAPGTAGPHKSDLLNKADPRVDADLDGSKTYMGNKTYGN